MSSAAWLATREDIQLALDVKSTARDDAQIDREIEGASRRIEKFLHRRFAPTLDTRSFDWPNDQMGRSWRLWLDENELISVSSVVSGGVSLAPNQYFLEPVNYGPPYNRLDIDLSKGGAFSSGSTYQRAIAISGLYGYSNDSTPVGTTVGTFSSSNDTATTVMPRVGVGSVLQVESERMLCTERSMADTGRTITGNIAASTADSSALIPTDGATIFEDEVILIDAERMLVTDVVGSNLVVKRAWSGTVLAAHTSGAKIYALRSFRVTRGALGTTAAQHLDGTTWTAWSVPGPVRDLCIAEVLNTFQQEQSAYARVVGSGDHARNAAGAGIEDIRAQVYGSHGRKGRQRAI